MKKALRSLLLLMLLATMLDARGRFSNDEEIHGAFQIIGGNSQTYVDQDLIGFGMRIAFPAVSDSLYLGIMVDGIINGDTSSTAHLGFALDLRLVDELFFAANYGWAAGSNDGNTTDATGKFYDLGLQYQLSEYIGFGLMYRNSDYTTATGFSLHEEELLYSFNIAMTMETWIFFDILFNN